MKQFSTFMIGERLFGIDIRLIQEINRISDVTPLPLAADYVRGFINLRGQIVTILDLRVRLGLERREMDENSHNIILKPSVAVTSGAGSAERGATTPSVPVGFLADAIGDVIAVDESCIEPLPANVGDADGRFLSGVIKLEDRLVVLFDLERVLHAA